MNAVISKTIASEERTPVFVGDFAKHVQLRISIIVPVLNEAFLIRSFLKHLRTRARGAEIIVVDGGSSDRTAEMADGLCDQLLKSERNRAAQMNVGARAASGNVLWFLHVDAEVPSQCLDEIARTLNDPDVAGGYFRIRLPRSPFVYRLTDTFAHYVGILLRIRCGDHGIFCRRSAFFGLNGFPEVPLMEDVEFFRMLHRHGRLCAIDKRIIANPRRYQEVGPLRLTLAYGLIATLYAAGARLTLLASIYSRMCCRAK